MATGMFQKHTGHLRPTREKKAAADLKNLFQTPLPPFNVVFPSPPAFSKSHDIYAMHRAANRIFRSRSEIYLLKGKELSAPNLLEFVRDDIVSNLLAVERTSFGPFKFETYVFLKGLGLHAWRGSHREQAEEMLSDFQRHYRKKKERPSALARNDVWGARPAAE